MQLSEAQVKKFQELYFSHFGKKIDEQEASVLGIKLVNLVEAIYKPKNMKMKRNSNEQESPE